MTVNLDDLEPIDPDLRDCLAEELARLPGSRVVKRRGRLIFQGLNGFEMRADVLCAAKARWAELQRCGPFTDEQIWDFLVLLIGGDVRLRNIPGVGYSLDLPPGNFGPPQSAHKANGHAAPCDFSCA